MQRIEASLLPARTWLNCLPPMLRATNPCTEHSASFASPSGSPRSAAGPQGLLSAVSAGFGGHTDERGHPDTRRGQCRVLSDPSKKTEGKGQLGPSLPHLWGGGTNESPLCRLLRPGPRG